MDETRIRVEDLTTADGHEVFVVRPEGDPHGPGVVYLHWFDEAPNANRSQFLDEARILAASGVVSVLPQLTFPWQHAPVDIETDLGRISTEVGYLRDVWSVLVDHDGVDPSRIAVVGHDFGAMHGTLLMRELETRCAVLVAATPRWADWFVRFWPITTDRYEYMRRMSGVDPVEAIRDAGCPVLFQFGDRDFYIAAMTARELVDAAPEPKRLLTYDTGHAMDLPDITRDRMAFLGEHLGIEIG